MKVCHLRRFPTSRLGRISSAETVAEVKKTGCRWTKVQVHLHLTFPPATCNLHLKLRRWRWIAMDLYLETPRSSSSAETTSYSAWCSKRTGKQMEVAFPEAISEM